MISTSGLVAALLLGLALAMDAFAVALTQGARFRPDTRDGLLIAGAFGVAQGVMPLIGWLIGAFALAYVASVDHWIAFALLAFLGGRMIFDGDEDEEGGRKLAGWPLFVAAIATSIDALAAGLALPTLSVDPIMACVIIAVVTFLMSALGVVIGRKAGDRFGRPAEILGGVILIGLGVRIVVDHMGLI